MQFVRLFCMAIPGLVAAAAEQDRYPVEATKVGIPVSSERRISLLNVYNGTTIVLMESRSRVFGPGGAAPATNEALLITPGATVKSLLTSGEVGLPIGNTADGQWLFLTLQEGARATGRLFDLSAGTQRTIPIEGMPVSSAINNGRLAIVTAIGSATKLTVYECKSGNPQATASLDGSIGGLFSLIGFRSPDVLVLVAFDSLRRTTIQLAPHIEVGPTVQLRGNAADIARSQLAARNFPPHVHGRIAMHYVVSSSGRDGLTFSTPQAKQEGVMFAEYDASGAEVAFYRLRTVVNGQPTTPVIRPESARGVADQLYLVGLDGTRFAFRRP